MKQSYEEQATEIKQYFKLKKDLEKQARVREKEERASHKCSGCPYATWTSEKKVFCPLPNSCVKE
jgi:hypothetical protein